MGQQHLRAFRLALKSVSCRDSRSLQASPMAERSTSKSRARCVRRLRRRRYRAECYNPSAQRGRWENNVPPRFAFGGIWDLPFGPGRALVPHGWASHIVGYWQAGQHHLPGAKRPALHRQSTVRQRQRGHDVVSQPRVPRDARASDALPMVRYELLRRPAGLCFRQ
jgi:hypothetical protein